MALTKKVNLKTKESKLTEAPNYTDHTDRGIELAGALYNQFQMFHSVDRYDSVEVQKVLLKQMQKQIDVMETKGGRPSTFIFSPSGASKCSRELYLKANRTKTQDDKFPYQRRWTRNSTAVHEAIQKDLLTMSIGKQHYDFKVKFNEEGLPIWEESMKTFKLFNHKGQDFAMLGMMDGILQYKDGSEIGFEFKTKSNTIGQVGNYKMKSPAPYHLEQCTAYSLLFGMDEFVLMYESLAKDGWTKGEEAKLDFRTFYHRVTEEEKTALLDKMADVVIAVKAKELPEGDFDKCIFCPYKHLCK